MYSVSKPFRIFKEKISIRIVTISLASFISWLFTPVLTAQSSGAVQAIGEGISAKKFYASTIDKDNSVWFLTESGIISFDGTKWSLHNKNQKVAQATAQGIVYGSSSAGQELLLATPQGAAVASLPVSENSGVTSFNPENSKIPDNFLPDEIKGTVFYDPGTNPKEEEVRKRLSVMWKDIYNYDKK